MTYHQQYSPHFTNLPGNGKLFVPENQKFVIDVNAVDNVSSEGNGLHYDIVGGVDKDFFKIDSTTGVLEFKDAPDFENPQSNWGQGDNIYDVKIRVRDTKGYSSHKDLWVMVTDVDETPQDPILPDGTYQLCNHPDGAAALPNYGLRLDGLTTGNTDDIFTFNFEHPDADVRMTIDGDSVRIFGVAFGGLDIGDSYDPNASGLWEIDFTYDNVKGLAGDDDFTVDGLNPKSTGTNTGSIKQLFGAQETFDLTEFSNMDGASFFLGDGEDDQGHRGFDGISGWGWHKHSGSDDRLSSSDWLFTVKPEPLKASIGDKVFLDADRDGVQDPGEAGVEGVTVTIAGAGSDGVFGTADDTEDVTTTDGNGNYDVGDLAPGDYKVTFSDLPAGLDFTTPGQGGDEATDSDADPTTGMTDVITLNGGDVNNDVDAGLVAPISPASIGDKVFLDADRDGIQDPGESGVEGVTVTITGAGSDGVFGTADDTEDVTTTDGNGNYDVGDLAPGDYKVTFSDLPAGLDFTTPGQGGDEATDSDADPTTGMTDVITLGEGETNNDVDAGLVAPISPASIGDKVFLDADRDGIQDPGESGVEGVTVTITGAGSDGVFGTADDTEDVTTTDGNGNYDVGDLAPGDYKVTFSDLPAGLDFTTPGQGGDEATDSDADPTTGMTDVITLGEGETNNDVDAGLVAPISPASIGDKVFLDADRDGIQDPGESGVEGVTVTITGAGSDGVFGTADDTEDVTTTDGNGNYDVGDLAPGDYKVTFSDLPAGLDFTTPGQGGDEATDSDADPTTGMTDVITLGEGETNNDVDAGLVAPVLPARLGNRVFDDRNQNGIQDNGEAGVSGVTVTLAGGGEDGLLSTLGDNIEETTVTNQRGLYSFKNLTPGEYKVTFSDLPDGFEFTTQDQGTNEAKDSDADPISGMTDIVVLESGEINNKIDAGIFMAIQPTEKNFIRGTIAPDFLAGTDADDDIRGLGDSDTITGFDGDDCLYGNGGFDILRGGAGADSLFGGQQNDTLFGDSGADILSGGTGSDSLVGGGGNDTLDGTNGSGANEQDVLAGGGGRDLFILGDANSAYYIASGAGDFATIKGFSASADTIQLNGSVGDYETQQNGTDLELLSSGELIAVFQSTNALDLNAVGSFV